MRRGLLGAALLVVGFGIVVSLAFFWNGWQSAIAEYPVSAFNIVLEGSYAPFLVIATIFILTGIALSFQKGPKQIWMRTPRKKRG